MWYIDLDTNEDRLVKYSDYARIQGLYPAIQDYAPWLFRLPNMSEGNYRHFCSYVTEEGKIENDALVDATFLGVRPCITINLR